jgi:hypothetical protein
MMMIDFMLEELFDVPINRVMTLLLGVLLNFDTYANKDDLP